ncbi:hypothetical protein [Rubricoccus marinus]|uniref:Uncharacterized protein n=1 Tax=Rubricoccus marinus TaxID=716817 RepID=A0A259U1V7_9BACT|nr:hypothetical protein [Rubricoccus marinus]OZC03920.1 hypothetical protein BSZ36_13580 [Rubricoccus marinus]
MGRILLLVFLGGLGAWAASSAAKGPSAVRLANAATSAARPTRAYYVPIYVPPPPRSNRTGSTSGPRVGGGGPSFGK